MIRIGAAARLVLLGLALGCTTEGPVVEWADAAPVLLPVEVLGPPGTERAIGLRLPFGAPPPAALALEVHGLRFAGQATVRVNDGAPIALGADPATIAAAARAYGGLGGPGAVRLVVPIPPGTTRPGPQTVRFRFERGDGVVSGFRVLSVDLLGADGRRLLPASAFREDLPSTWRPPRPAAADLERGRRLWQEAPLTVPSPEGARPLRATCAGCHTRDGRDLKYFGYSNLAIVERAKLYGLDQEAAEQIASHVRALDLPTLGRPWNPPYQPGPGLDRRPIAAWAAGAGLGAIVATDGAALDALFPAGVSRDTLSSKGTLNLREAPLPFALPDWNRGLPRVHPLDAWGDGFAASGVLQLYEAMREKLRAGGWVYARGAFEADLYRFGVQAFEFLVAEEEKRREAGADLDVAARVVATRRWLVVKLWELMQEFRLEPLGAELHGAGGEARTWFARWGFVWAAAPPPPPADAAPEVKRAVNYERAAFHHLSAVTNPGNRRHVEHSPLDWAGAFGTVRALAGLGTPEAARLVAYAVKALQEVDNGVGPDEPERGFSLYLADPARLVEESVDPAWAGIPPERRRAILEAYLATWLDKARSYPPAAFKRTATFVGKTWAADPADHVPTPSPAGGVSDRLLYAIPRFREAGVSEALLGGLCDVGEALWPRGAWDALRR